MAENRRNHPDDSDDAFAPKKESDPLAELARLIGQSDPFADGARSARKPLDTSFRASDRPAPEWLARPAAAPEEHDYDPRPPHREPLARHHDDRYDDAAHHAHDDRAQHAGHFADDGHRHDAGHDAPAAHQHTDAGHDQYDDRYRVAPPPPGDYEDSYYADDGHMPPHGEEGYAPPKRRGGIVTIAAVLGLAVIGTAGAFGYRAFTSGPSTPGEAKVIKADTTPAKIVPPAPASVDAQGKPFQERVSTTTERIVPREEQPVSLPVPPPPSRTSPPQAAFASAPSAPLVAPPPSTPPGAFNEPKRVKTEIIRPGGAEATTTRQAPPPAEPVARAPAAKQQGPGPMTIAPAEPTSARNAPNIKMAARPTAPSAGAYVVQVSAQRTETEAQSSYRAMQQKYPSVLGNREPNIRRVDLGAQGGIFYRAQVGSFATMEQATALCNDLKNAGGQCIVQRN